jgi:hypothetical protein
MTLYGTPETATTMMDNMAKGFGLRSMVEGFVNGANGNGATASGSGDLVGGLISQVGGLIQPALAKVSGTDTPRLTPEISESVARSLAENPAFLAALQEALAKSKQETSTPVAIEATPLTKEEKSTNSVKK